MHINISITAAALTPAERHKQQGSKQADSQMGKPGHAAQKRERVHVSLGVSDQPPHWALND